MIAPAPEVVSSLRQQLDRWLAVSQAANRTTKRLTPAEVSERNRLRLLVATQQAPPLGFQRLRALDRKALESALARREARWTLTVRYAWGERRHFPGLSYQDAQDLKTESLNQEGAIEAVLEPEVARG